MRKGQGGVRHNGREARVDTNWHYPEDYPRADRPTRAASGGVEDGEGRQDDQVNERRKESSDGVEAFLEEPKGRVDGGLVVAVPAKNNF